jgi:hypothetical protein
MTQVGFLKRFHMIVKDERVRPSRQVSEKFVKTAICRRRRVTEVYKVTVWTWVYVGGLDFARGTRKPGFLQKECRHSICRVRRSLQRSKSVSNTHLKF